MRSGFAVKSGITVPEATVGAGALWLQCSKEGGGAVGGAVGRWGVAPGHRRARPHGEHVLPRAVRSHQGLQEPRNKGSKGFGGAASSRAPRVGAPSRRSAAGRGGAGGAGRGGRAGGHTVTWAHRATAGGRGTSTSGGGAAPKPARGARRRASSDGAARPRAGASGGAGRGEIYRGQNILLALGRHRRSPR